jgi:hypothetical protein
MTKFLKMFPVFLLAVLWLGAATGLRAAENRDGVFIHISHGADDPHRLLMALNMANMMSGPGCLKVAGKTGADLAPGVQVADKAKFFSFTSGRIITLDY